MKKLLFIILAVLFITSINAVKLKRTFYKNGKSKTSIIYSFDGKRKMSELTHYKNGRTKTIIEYSYEDGTKEKGYPQCFKYKRNKQGAQEKCRLAKHGCTASSNTCIK